MTKKLTREQILQIPALKETMTVEEVAAKLKSKPRTIRYWIPRLRKEGYKVKNDKRGVKAINLR